ncbi:alpha/beta fold hydrolase [Streptomyces sp. Ag109_O5-1]|uniref:alpha/beta fold hydrolase n=1 Tax=Streptomyces sp. Ag109_O5-1 TaxID=1938851 RepID=UPI000F50C7D5|nr:alpha/beta fold hydrolase [Streptomyces sp. Ag109_O5-1]
MSLADTFTVVVPDRRGRGLSPHPYTPDYTVDDDVHDLDAVLQATGARFVYGLSSGAGITLKAALALPGIEKIALYEPSTDLAGMLVTGTKLARLGLGLIRAMPDRVVTPAIRAIMKKEAASGSGHYATMAELALAFQYDFAIVRSMDDSIPAFGTLTRSVLLLGGSKSPAFLARSLDQLQQVIPTVRRVTLDGVGHDASWNVDPQRNPHGNPKAVADQLKRSSPCNRTDRPRRPEGRSCHPHPADTKQAPDRTAWSGACHCMRWVWDLNPR